MSKLLDKLRQISRSGTAGMGFRPAPAEGLPLLLIPYLSGSEEPLPPYGDAMALNLSPALSHPPSSPGEGVPWGVVAQGKPLKKEELARLEEKGCDFLLLTSLEARGVVLEASLARFLPLDPSQPDSWLRAVVGLGDGGVIDLQAGPLTLWHLVQCRRLTGLFSQPVLALAPAGLTAGEARQLAETGVLGIVSPDLASEKKFKQWREALSSPPPHRAGPPVLLPQPSHPPQPQRE